MTTIEKTQVTCPSCQERYALDLSRFTLTGGRFTCRICGEKVEIRARTTPKAVPSPIPSTAEVSCPKCGHHFTPDKPFARPVAPSEGSAPDGKKTILIVEDTEFFLDLAQEVLGHRYRTIGVRTVTEALEILKQTKIDLMLLDLALDENEDGLSVLRMLPEKPCPILIFTSKQDTDLFGEGWEDLRRAGADDLLLKGINVEEEMLSKVAKLLAVTTSS